MAFEQLKSEFKDGLGGIGCKFFVVADNRAYFNNSLTIGNTEQISKSFNTTEDLISQIKSSLEE